MQTAQTPSASRWSNRLNQISKKGQSNQQSEKIAAESWRRGKEDG
jgi:hypothetical protein